MDTLMQDLRYALRTLLRTPGFTLAAVATLALGIGANTAIFSAVNTALLRPPARVADPASLVGVYVGVPEHPYMNNSYPDFRDLRDAGTGALAGLAARRPELVNVAVDDEPRPVLAEFVSGGYFGVVGVQPVRGRAFAPGEDGAPGAHPVAVISHGLWTRQFGGDPGIVGRRVKVNGHELTVIGVAPRGFLGLQFGARTDFWIPMAMSDVVAPGGPSLESRGSRWLSVVGRLRPGVSVQSAQAQVAAVGRRLAAANQVEWTGMGDRAMSFSVVPLGNAPPEARGILGGVAGMLMTVVVLVLVICCANVANLLLARATGRSREIAIRLAMGAARGRILRQLLTESMVLAAAGGALGIALAVALLRGVMAISLPVAWPVEIDLAPDGRVIAFALAVTVATGALFGLAPALRASRPDLVPELKDEAAAAGRGRRFTLRNALVVTQVAVSLVLLLVAGLLVRSLGRMQGADPGFDTAHVALVEANLGALGYDDARLGATIAELEARLRAVPGVRSASAMRIVPLSINEMTMGVQIEGQPQPASARPLMSGFNLVGAEYFQTLRLPLVAGRPFTAADRAGALPVAVVNQAFARRFWPGQSALGRRVSDDGGATWRQVVGVARDAKYVSMTDVPQPHLYIPIAQHPAGELAVAVRTDGDPAAVLPALRAATRALLPDLSVAASTMEQKVAVGLLPQRILALLLAGFGALGMLLAAVGLYAVMAYSVSRRRKEIGIRVALGASAGRVVRLVVGQGMRLTATGLGVGIALAAGITHLIAALLYGVSPLDPATFVGVPALLAGVALVASWLPARRATRVDPMAAIRAE